MGIRNHLKGLVKARDDVTYPFQAMTLCSVRFLEPKEKVVGFVVRLVQLLV